MTEKVAQQEESLYPDPELPADTPVAQRLCLSRLSTLPSPSWPIRCPMYSLGFVLYKLLVRQDGMVGSEGGYRRRQRLQPSPSTGFDRRPRQGFHKAGMMGCPQNRFVAILVLHGLFAMISMLEVFAV